NNAHHVSDEILKLIKQGTPYHKIDRSTETVTLYVPIANFSGEYALYITYEYQTQYFARIRNVIIISIIICLIGLILSGTILMILYRQVTNPIHELVAETEKIKSFNLDDKVKIRASLFEIQAL